MKTRKNKIVWNRMDVQAEEVILNAGFIGHGVVRPDYLFFQLLEKVLVYVKECELRKKILFYIILSGYKFNKLISSEIPYDDFLFTQEVQNMLKDLSAPDKGKRITVSRMLLYFGIYSDKIANIYDNDGKYIAGFSDLAEDASEYYRNTISNIYFS